MRKAIGLIIGFSGVILTYLPKGELQLVLGIGEICILTSAFIASYGNIVTKRALSHYTPHYLSGYGMIIGSSILIVIGAGNVGFQTLSFGSSEWFMLLYLSFLSAAGFILWNNIMRYHAVGKVSLFMFLVPIFGVILSSILLNEQLYVLTLVGLLLVTVGIIVVNAQFTAWKQLKKRSDIA